MNEIKIETYNRKTPSKISKITVGCLFWVKEIMNDKTYLFPIVCTGKVYVGNLKKFFFEGYYIRNDQKAGLFSKEDIITKHELKKHITNECMIYSDNSFSEEKKLRCEANHDMLHERVKNIRKM